MASFCSLRLFGGGENRTSDNPEEWDFISCENGLPPQVGPVNFEAAVGPMRAPDFKGLTLDQLMAFHWRVRAWTLDISIAFTATWQKEDGPDVNVQTSESFSKTLKNGFEADYESEIANPDPEIPFSGDPPTEKSLLCSFPVYKSLDSFAYLTKFGVINDYTRRPFDPDLIPESLTYPRRYYVDGKSYGINPTLDIYISGENFNVGIGTYEGGETGAIQGAWPTGSIYPMTISWLGTTLSYTVGVTGFGYGNSPDEEGYNIVEQSQTINSFQASLVASQYWGYDPNDGGGPIYDTATGVRIRDDV
jgi:hypothetical protein